MDEIKVSDIVGVSKNAPNDPYRGPIPTNREFTVTAIGREYAEIKLKDALMPTFFCAHVKYLIKVNAEPKEPTRMRVISKEDFLKELNPTKHKVVTEPYFDWQRYVADLAKEIAVKLANVDKVEPNYAAVYAVTVAKSVVENLKKRKG